MTLDAVEFLRRFLMHVLPNGFVRIRYFGYLGNHNRKKNIEQARKLIGYAGELRFKEQLKPKMLCPECRASGLGNTGYIPWSEFDGRPPPAPGDAFHTA